MIGNLGRRAFEAVVLLFAVLGFAFMPLGRHTALEHLKAILATGAAANAGRELVQAADRLKRSLLAPDSKPKRGKPPANAKIAPALGRTSAGADAGAADASQTWTAS